MKSVPEVKIILLGSCFILVLVALCLLGQLSQKESRGHVDSSSMISQKVGDVNNNESRNLIDRKSYDGLNDQTKLEIFKKAIKADELVNQIGSSSSLESLKYGDILTVKNQTVALTKLSDIESISKWKYFTGDTKVKFVRVDTYRGKNYICVGLNSGAGRKMKTVWISDLAVSAEVDRIYMERFDTEWDKKEALREQKFLKIAKYYSITDDQVYEILAEGLHENW